MNGEREGPAAITADIITARQASGEQIAQRQAERLAQLLSAARKAPFYGRWLAAAGVGVTLRDLPVSGKAQLMREFAERVTDPRLSLPGLRAWCADPARIGERYLGDYWVWESSGSSGEPGIFVQDRTAMAVYDALEALRRHIPRPWDRLWDPLYYGERFAFVGAIEGHFASFVSLQRLRATNPWLATRWRGFSILQPTADLVAQLDAFGPSIIATYPTAAAMLAEEAAAGRLRTRPREVWTGGENLSPAIRRQVEHAFGCPLCNSYGASEFLPIAWECAKGHLHVNADWVILEPVDAQHRPVAAGALSHTTLVTNLANHVQPLIRFDIGDQIRLGGVRCACGSALPVIEVLGRLDDVIVVPGRDGRPCSLLPLALTTVLEDEAGVFDFQLRQLGPQSWQLLLGPKEAAVGAQRARRALAEFASAQGAGQGLRIRTRHVDDLPLAHSGKLKRIVAATPPPAAAT